MEGGTGKYGEERLCRLSQSDVDALDSWAKKNSPQKRFTQVRLGAHKDPIELPLLGHDPTLPRHRPDTAATATATDSTKSSDVEYTIYYSVYGTLGDPALLSKRFDKPIDEMLPLRLAVCFDGRIRTWAGK